MLTTIILATNEEEDLPGCLESLKSLNCRIIVIDGGSADQTPCLARNGGAEVHVRPFDNFTEQRRHALSLVQTPWALMLDADERLSPDLAQEIKEAVQKDEADAYELPFEIQFMRRHMRFSGLGKEKHMRLFKTQMVELKQGLGVHEIFVVGSKRIGRLKNPVRHRPYKNLAEYLSKCNLYTDLATQDFLKNGKKLSWRHGWIPAWEFFRVYFLRLGILDGVPGLAWALLSAYHRRVRYDKIANLLKKPDAAG